MKSIDLSVLGIDNKKLIPIGYEKDDRQIYVEKNKGILEKLNMPLKEDVQKLSEVEFKTKLNAVRSANLIKSYDCEILPSSESEDNDTNSSDSEEEDSEDASWGN